MRHTRTGLSHFVSPDCESSPRCAADLVFYRCMRMNPLAPPAGGAFFMRAVLCATGDASAALSGGFACQRQGARSLPSGGQRVLGRQPPLDDRPDPRSSGGILSGDRLAAQSRQREEHMKKRKKSGSLSKAKKSAKSALRETGSKLKRVAKKAAAATGMA